MRTIHFFFFIIFFYSFFFFSLCQKFYEYNIFNVNQNYLNLFLISYSIFLICIIINFINVCVFLVTSKTEFFKKKKIDRVLGRNLFKNCVMKNNV